MVEYVDCSACYTAMCDEADAIQQAEADEEARYRAEEEAAENARYATWDAYDWHDDDGPSYGEAMDRDNERMAALAYDEIPF